MDPQRRHWLDLLSDFHVAMLTTHDVDGELHARPMIVADRGENGELVFCTRLDMDKVDEIERDARCSVTMQGKTRFLALAGHAVVSRDRARIASLWRETWRLWFPEGRDDPQLALVVVTPVRGEYWDESGLRGLRFLARAAEAWVHHRPMAPPEPEQHGRVTLQASPTTSPGEGETTEG